MGPNTRLATRPPPAPGVRSGTVLAGLFALAAAAWSVDRAWASGLLDRGAVHEATCGDLAEGGLPATARRVRLSDCRLDLAAASVVLSGPELEAVYAPLRVASGPTLGALPLLVRLEDPKLLAVLADLLRGEPPDDPTAWLAEHVGGDLSEVDGIVLRGRYLSATDAEHVTRQVRNLAVGSGVLVSPDRVPSPVPPGVAAVLLAVLALWGVVAPPSGIVSGTGARGRDRP